MKSMLPLAALVLAALSPAQGPCAELFPAGGVRSFQRFEPVDQDTTIGGYPIYQGGRTWRLADAQRVKNNMNVGIGHAAFVSPAFGAGGGLEYFAEMQVTAALTGTGDSTISGYFGGEPCGPAVQALVKVNKASGLNDNCLTIKPLTVTIAGQSIPTMEVHIRNSQTGFRLYDIRMLLALDKLGFAGTSDSAWTAGAVAQDAAKKQLMDKLGAWAGELQDAVHAAMPYSKPQDVFQKVSEMDRLLAPVTGTREAVAAQ